MWRLDCVLDNACCTPSNMLGSRYKHYKWQYNLQLYSRCCQNAESKVPPNKCDVSALFDKTSVGMQLMATGPECCRHN